MMDSIKHQFTVFNCFDLMEKVLFIPLVLLVLILLMHYFFLTDSKEENIKNNISFRRIQSWKKIPEVQLLMLSVPLQLLWEIAQFPLYTVWHESEWSYIIYGLIHCTLGDMLILISVFWIVSLLNRSRSWIYSPALSNIILFTILGLGYTIFSEIVNTRITNSWGYTELMPIVPIIEVGGMPFLQWLLIPSVLIWLMQIIRPTRAYE
ncbi:MAG: hypothetical protein OQK46_01125 [Gammaproteobacteria bacterium]|nr:hypothetical protein [Gammaproteobacteria bacterium]